MIFFTFLKLCSLYQIDYRGEFVAFVPLMHSGFIGNKAQPAKSLM